MKIGTFLLLAACLCQPVFAGSPADKEAETKRMREKEAERARTAAENYSNKEDFEKKYENLRESEPALFSDAMEKRQSAARAWMAVASGIDKVDSYDQLHLLKMPAYDAEAIAEIARMEMKAAGSIKEWKRNAEKSESRETGAFADQMIQNQKAIIQATKQQMASQKLLRQLEAERFQLEKKMREAYEKSKREQQEDRDKKDNQSSRDHEKKPSRDEDKEFRNEQPGKIRVE